MLREIVLIACCTGALLFFGGCNGHSGGQNYSFLVHFIDFGEVEIVAMEISGRGSKRFGGAVWARPPATVNHQSANFDGTIHIKYSYPHHGKQKTKSFTMDEGGTVWINKNGQIRHFNGGLSLRDYQKIDDLPATKEKEIWGRFSAVLNRGKPLDEATERLKRDLTASSPGLKPGVAWAEQVGPAVPADDERDDGR